MRQGAHRTYARPHNTEQRRSPKPVTAERDIYPPEFNVNVPKILHNSLFFFNNVPRGYITMGLSIPVQRTNRKARWDRMAKASAKSKTLSTAVALAMAASLSVPFTAYADEDANASQEATQQEETTAANDGSVTNNEETATVKATGETEADAKGAIALHSNESAQAVAEVDGMKYASIAAAIAAIDAKGTVTLLGDVTEDVTIPEGKAITLDLNGKKLTNKASHTITNNGTLMVTDSIGGGVVDNITHAKAALSNAVGATAARTPLKVPLK